MTTLMAAVVAGGLLLSTAASAEAQAGVVPEASEGREFFYDDGDDRYYEVVTYEDGDDRTWEAARDAAADRTIFGGAYRGYLATILTLEQNRFVVEEIGNTDESGVADDGHVNLWIGATDAGSEGDWRWATGSNAGTEFWRGGPSGAVVSGRFAAWATGEPNNEPSGGGPAENYAIANYRCTATPYDQPCTETSSWNDVVGSGTVTSYVAGYLVAYAPVPAAGAAPTLTCSPDPTTVGSVVTCAVAGGPAGAEILWRASVDSAFAGQGVTLGADGSGTFSFVAPAGSNGRSILVELVAWNAEDDVAVSGILTPTRIPAGPEFPAPMGLLAAGAIALLAVGARRRVRPTA